MYQVRSVSQKVRTILQDTMREIRHFCSCHLHLYTFYFHSRPEDFYPLLVLCPPGFRLYYGRLYFYYRACLRGRFFRPIR